MFTDGFAVKNTTRKDQLRLRTKKRLSLSLTGALTFLMLSFVPAGMANAQNEPRPEEAPTGSTNSQVKTRPGLIPYTEDLNPVKFINDDARELANEPGTMSVETEDGLWDMVGGHPGLSINAFEWDSASETLIIYSAVEAATLALLTQKYLPNQRTTLIPAKHSKEEIDAELSRMTENGGALPSGARIVTAIPAKDGSSIAVGVELSSDQARLDMSAMAVEINSTISIQVEIAQDVHPATRNIDYYLNFFSGAYMQSASINRSCTTGYRIANPEVGAGMLSAEHCGRDHIGTNWYYSSNSTSASLIGQFGGMLRGTGFAASDTGVWTGGNVAKMYPGIFTGDHLGGDPLEDIRGAGIPVIGNHVCYSGSRSGNVCSNEVIQTGTTVCYSATMCYSGIAWTNQIDSKEAAGNGDSGGPVYRRVDGKVYAAGIISGIGGGSSTCTGDPGSSTRNCSPTALYAPLNLALTASTGWGLNYVP